MVVRNREMKMPGVRHFSRIDLFEIKIQIEKKLGSQKAEKYFGLLDKFFSLKLSKLEFNKLCIATIGRENLRLHNLLIKSILKNVCLANAPPPNKLERLGHKRSSLLPFCKDVLPRSPRRGETPSFRNCKSMGKLSPLSQHEKPSIIACKDSVHNLEQQSATELLSLGSRPVEVNSVEDGEEVDQAAISPGIHSRGPITPLFGIPWNEKNTRKKLSSLLSASVHVDNCHSSGELPDTSSLSRRLEQKLRKEGLGISLECVNLLNSGLDIFLKRLIKPSLDLAGSRAGNFKQKNQMIDHGVPSLNGIWPGRYSQKPSQPIYSSMLDFRTTLELNPHMVGEDWPMQLEKISL